ncbi:FecR domain-containing protein [Akkermansiaceae bacterium]|nr:FecR domain-containing protein [Akkermansiaceae bacterium]MDB4322879.1 FecR domain-containing protein [Akkermansiaceae bacterium]MDB4461973.1 FecR domain-containing protein [bacterium]MDB4577815.1 FecR domain-containing protein [Akkermansiaceae bacterium]MDC1404144.1 FecR domain-containing protein [Akkermansiaceae bacterium]
MNDSTFSKLPEQEQRWIDAYFDGTIAEADFSALQERMLESAQLRKVMRRYLAMDASLMAQSDRETDMASASWLRSEQEAAPKITHFRIIPIAAAAGLAFLLGLGMMHFGSQDANDTTSKNSGEIVNDAEPFAEGFAVVGRVFDVQWSVQQTPFREGDTLGAEVVRLTSGTVEIQFFSGAMMTLQGPAEISLKSAWEASCLEGAVRMKVPPAARGFRLNAPSTKIVDLGTEFGLVVNGSTSHVEVFDGEIALTHQGEEEKILKKGHAMGLASAGPSVDAQSGQIAFPETGTFGPRAARELQGDFKRWQAHSQELAKDNRLLAYYTFDQDQPDSLISNLTVPRNPEFDGAVVMAEPVAGRWPQLNSALEFRRPGSRVRVNIPGEFEAFTFSCWVRIDSLDRQYNALFMGDGYENGEPHWQIRHDGKMMLSIMVDDDAPHPIYPDKSRYHHLYFSPPMWNRSMSGQWVHLSSVYDPAQRAVSHYVNGARVSRETISPLFLVEKLRIGNGEIGNWGQPFREDPTFAIRNLNGRMDEFAIFKAALSDQEIATLFEKSRAKHR